MFYICSAGNEFSGGTEKYKTPVIVDSDGTNKWYCPGSFTCTCKIDVTYFPFDRQTCKLKFGSWTFEVSLDLNVIWYIIKEQQLHLQLRYLHY